MDLKHAKNRTNYPFFILTRIFGFWFIGDAFIWIIAEPISNVHEYIFRCLVIKCIASVTINLAFHSDRHLKVTSLSPFFLRIVLMFEIFEHLGPVNNYIYMRNKMSKGTKGRGHLPGYAQSHFHLSAIV